MNRKTDVEADEKTANSKMPGEQAVPEDQCAEQEAEKGDACDAQSDGTQDTIDQPASCDEKKGEEAEEKESGDLKYMRLAADFQNFKRRVEKEKSDIYAYANEKIAIDIIDVMDNFERAMIHSEDSSDKNLVEGMNMIMKQMTGLLNKHDIIEIEATDKDFDPRFHNAVMTEKIDDCDSGKVIQVLQKGYTLKGKVIRPSMVKVSQ